MPQMLLTRPEHDPTTRYLSYWSGPVIDAAISKGFTVTELRKEKANQGEFEGRMKKLDPTLVVLNGHGNADEVTGHNNFTLVKRGTNHHLLSKRITYAVSCESAQALGTACADEETAYIGYDESFIFNGELKYLKNPLRDLRAGRFLESSNQVVLSLLKGHTVKEASDRSKGSFARRIIELLGSSSTDPDALADAKDLYWDMIHQVHHGNASLKATMKE